MTRLAPSELLRPGWCEEIIVPGVSSDLPGIYEWHIEGIGCYIGQYTHAQRPRNEYRLNIERILCQRPYRLGKPEGFRLIHVELARAAQSRQKITLTLLENHVIKADRNRRERELIAERRADATITGLRVLNSG